MHYKINNYLIKSENAARSYKQASSFLISLINSINDFENVLDYGCGKLRYSDILVNKSLKQVFSDSSIQINRIQNIHGEKTSINKFVESHYPNAKTYTIENIEFLKMKFDFILCSNVISAVPCERERDLIMLRIKSLLKHNGISLFTSHYKDSYFDNFSKRDNCFKHLDGYIIKNQNNCSFYGLVTPDILKMLLFKNNFKVIKEIDRKGSIYIFAR